MHMMVGTTYILADEPCFSLSEVNLPRPDSRGWNRYQVIYVLRNDHLAEHRVDLGPQSTAPLFRIPGGVINEGTGKGEIVETVGALQDVANFLRAGHIEEPVHEVSDLLEQWSDKIEAEKLVRRGRGVLVQV